MGGVERSVRGESCGCLGERDIFAQGDERELVATSPTAAEAVPEARGEVGVERSWVVPSMDGAGADEALAAALEGVKAVVVEEHGLDTDSLFNRVEVDPGWHRGSNG